MIIVIGPDATEEQKQAVKDKIIELGYTPHEIVGVERQVIGAVGEDHGKDHLMEVLESMAGVESLYHIPPNMSPHEIDFGKRVLGAAAAAGVSHVVYHSVIHPQIQGLPHHWNKLFVEEAVIESGLRFTILQPSSYMQNTLGDWQRITEEGVHRMAFSLEAPMSLVDLDDVGEAAATVIGKTWTV